MIEQAEIDKVVACMELARRGMGQCATQFERDFSTYPSLAITANRDGEFVRCHTARQHAGTGSPTRQQSHHYANGFLRIQKRNHPCWSLKVLACVDSETRSASRTLSPTPTCPEVEHVIRSLADTLGAFTGKPKETDA